MIVSVVCGEESVHELLAEDWVGPVRVAPAPAAKIDKPPVNLIHKKFYFLAMDVADTGSFFNNI